MIQIQICEMDVAEYKVDNGYNGYLVSIIDSDMYWKPVHDRHFVINFDDIPHAIGNKVPPGEYHLQKILKFASTMDDYDFLLIHCKQGISRSPAVAIAIMIDRGMPYKDAYNYIYGIRDQMVPNTRIIAITDELYSLGGALIEYDKMRKNSQYGVLWTPKK